MAVNSNQQPVSVTHKEILTGETLVTVVQPLVGLDGGVSKTTEALKTEGDVWHPFRGLQDTTEYVAAPATRTSTAADNTATIAAGLAQI